MPRRPSPPTAGGFTVVELAVVFALVALLSAMAAPALGHLMERHRLLEAAHTLQADLAYARYQALRSGQNAHLSFHVGQPWCYAVSLGRPADCRLPKGAAHVLKQVQGEQFPKVMLLQANPMVVDGRSGMRRGALSQALLATPTGPKLAVQLGAMGRVSLCTPLQVIQGLPHCSQLAAP